MVAEIKGDKMAEIICADVLEWCKTYDGPKFHALLCDPPYELGFMGKDWDKTGIVFDPDTWAALAEHLHPGAFGFAFASSRRWHRMACAIEDAGLRVHPSIWGWGEKQFLWVYGSGFPKATRIDTQIEKTDGRQGAITPNTGKWKGGNSFGGGASMYAKDGERTQETHYTPQTDLAKAWEGHRYGGQCLKPAAEPIIVFQKPYDGKPVESIVETGAGALNIDGARIGTETLPECRAGQAKIGTFERKDMVTPERQGRWPANFYLGDEEAARRLGEQSGKSKSVDSQRNNKARPRSVAKGAEYDHSTQGFSDSGTAARFFFNVNTKIDDADPVMYQAKASRKERDAGLDGICTIKLNVGNKGGIQCDDLMAVVQLLRKVTSELAMNWNIGESGGSIMAQCRADYSFTTSTAIKKIIESKISLLLMPLRTSEFTADATSETENGGNHAESVERLSQWLQSITSDQKGLARGVALVVSEMLLKTSDDAEWKPNRNIHSTVKPIDLTRWLATLLLPPDEYAPRRILIPFSGSGSEMIGAQLAGWEETVGIEMEVEYVEIAKARLEHWAKENKQLELL